MATVQEYLNAQKLATSSIETMRRIVRRAYDAAQATTHAGNYERLEKLVDDATRTTFKDKLVESLIGYVQSAITALPENSLFHKLYICS